MDNQPQGSPKETEEKQVGEGPQETAKLSISELPPHVAFSAPDLDKFDLPKLVRSEVTLAGDPALGTVHHLYYVHTRPGATRESFIEKGQSLGGIVRDLKTLDIKSAFLESTTNEDIAAYEPGGTYFEFAQKDLKALSEAFPNRILPERLDESQAFILGRQGTGIVLKYFLPNMQLFGTYPRGAERILKHADNMSYSEEDRRAIIMELREFYATLEILEQTRGKASELMPCALIYGANHRFESDTLPAGIEPAEAPRFVKHFSDELGTFMISSAFLKANEEAQLYLVSKSRRFLDYVFRNAQSDAVRLALLPKLEADPDYYDSPEALFMRLGNTLDQANAAPEVHELLKQLYAERSGPFSDLVVRPGFVPDREKILRCPDELISTEDHPYTQLQLIRLAYGLRGWVFNRILSKTGQLEALPKISSPDIHRGELKDRLLESSYNDEVRQEIQRRFEANLPPFAIDTPIPPKNGE